VKHKHKNEYWLAYSFYMPKGNFIDYLTQVSYPFTPFTKEDNYHMYPNGSVIDTLLQEHEGLFLLLGDSLIRGENPQITKI